MRALELAAGAETDLRDIWLFTNDCDTATANRLLAKINGMMDRLRSQPGLGHLRRDLTDLDYRFATVGPCHIIYWYTAAAVEVARVVHGSRDLGPTLAGL